ncbi:MAG: hypothetical protein VKQ33_01810 [Candidatus Sericytochromatia bacterium]|nr:hypothetical protein [Candidatus Sericytochromatia bacterium]
MAPGLAPSLAGGLVPGGLGATPGQTTERKLYAVWVMKGRALVDGTTPLANAELRAYDVETGLPLSFGAWDAAGQRALPGVARTDAEGRWTLAFTPIVGNRVLRLVARTPDRTVVTLFTSTGQVLPGQAERGAGRYRLKQQNPLFQNAIWWFGTPNPMPPLLRVLDLSAPCHVAGVPRAALRLARLLQLRELFIGGQRHGGSLRDVHGGLVAGLRLPGALPGVRGDPLEGRAWLT